MPFLLERGISNPLGQSDTQFATLSSFSLDGYSVCQRSRHKVCPFAPFFVVDLTCGWFPLAGLYSGPHLATCVVFPIRFGCSAHCWGFLLQTGMYSEISEARVANVSYEKHPATRVESGLHWWRVNLQLSMQFEHVWKNIYRSPML